MTKREEKEKALKALSECIAKGEKKLKVDGLEHKHIHFGNEDDEESNDE